MRLLFIIDPPRALNPKKDSTIALMRAASSRGDEVYFAEQHDMRAADGAAWFHCARATLSAGDDAAGWLDVAEAETAWQPARFFDAILMRKEPPVDEAFAMATRLLDIAARHTRVINAPRALREDNEKLSILNFPDLIPPTWVGADDSGAEAFRRAHGMVALKPLNAMGGWGVYISPQNDLNFRSVFDMLTERGGRMIMLQRYLPEAREGDFRLFAVAGGGLPWMLARVPREDDHRGNMAAGGQPVTRPLDDAGKKILDAVAPVIYEKGIAFAGLDMIGGALMEINITCPTGLREVSDQTGEDVAGEVLRRICA